MRKLLPYLLILITFSTFIFWKHPVAFSYKFNQDIVHDYLRSQDIEDPEGNIHDRIFISDSKIYQSAGYLYSKGVSPETYNFQHPPLIKYLFGFSILLTNNPFIIQIFFALIFLFLVYFLSTKVFKNKLISLIPVGLVLIDPVFGGMMEGTYLDMGQSTFALIYLILSLFFPEKYILAGIILGLFAASKFWSTAVIFVVLIYAYKLIIRKEKINIKRTATTFLVAFLIYSLTYVKYFIDGGGIIGFLSLQGKIIKFMLNHNSAGGYGGSIFLFLTGYFSSWWQTAVSKAGEWSILWPIGLFAGLFEGIKSLKQKTKTQKPFIYLLPIAYLLLTGTGVPFTRYFLIILPFVYIGLTGFIMGNSSDG